VHLVGFTVGIGFLSSQKVFPLLDMKERVAMQKNGSVHSRYGYSKRTLRLQLNRAAGILKIWPCRSQSPARNSFFQTGEQDAGIVNVLVNQ
jgi:hypothetical protein